MGNHSPDSGLLRYHLGTRPVVFGHLVEATCLVCADFCHWARCAEMVSDALVDVEYWVVCSLGWKFGG
jgi:hypothetical protein